jgi:HEAT repeat protein
MKIAKILIVIAIGLMSPGCLLGPRNQEPKPPVSKMPAPPPELPAPPRPMAVKLDPDLRARALAVLNAECNESNAFLRSNAIEAIADVSPDTAQDQILKGLSDPEPAVRFTAAISAGKLRLRAAYAPLAAMLGDSDVRVQAAVRYALHRLGNTSHTHDLERFAADFDSKIRACTAQVLGLLAEPSGVKILLVLSHDRVAAVRLQAAEALWLLGNEQGLKDLVADTISGYPDDQIIALTAIAEPRDQRVLQHARGQLMSDYPEVCLAAARAVGMLGSDEGWTVAVKGVASPDPRQRTLGALAMGAIGRSDQQSRLAPLLNDSNPEVRIAGATAILQLKSPAEQG